MALFYQFGGSSSKGPLSTGEWRCMKVNELNQVVLVDGEWHTGETKGVRRSPCVYQVDVEVEFKESGNGFSGFFKYRSHWLQQEQNNP